MRRSEGMGCSSWPTCTFRQQGEVRCRHCKEVRLPMRSGTISRPGMDGVCGCPKGGGEEEVPTLMASLTCSYKVGMWCKQALGGGGRVVSINLVEMYML